jgi:protein SCO1/2
MRRAAILICLLVVVASAGACSNDDEPKPLSVPGEKLYTVRGTVLSRDVAGNSLHIDHEAIPGFMEAMAMDYTVRGAQVASLPKDKSRIEAKLHVTSTSYWITDVRAIP